MLRRISIAAVVGASVGVAVFVGWRFADRSDDTGTAGEPTTTSTTVVEVEAPWIADGVRFETTVIIPLTFTVADGTAELEYVAETISPALERHGEQVAGTPIDVLFRPERWVLEMEGTSPVEATTDGEAGSVRFSVPDAATSEDLVALRVTGWRRAVLVGQEVVLPLEPDVAATLHDGTRLVVQTVLEQATSTIVQIEVEEPEDLWHTHGGFAFRSVDGRWRLSGGFGGGGFQMTWEGEDAPGEIALVLAEPQWEPIDADVTIIDEATR